MSDTNIDAGKIIDMPFDEFKEELIKQKVNVGTMKTLILWFESIYAELRGRKDQIIQLVHRGVYKKEDPEVSKSLNGLYAEMTKIEQKVTYLKDTVRRLEKLVF